MHRGNAGPTANRFPAGTGIGIARFACALLLLISLTEEQELPMSEPVGEEFDLQGFIDERIKTGKKKIVIPPGQYRVKPRERGHLWLMGLADIEIVADSVEMICTQTTRAVTINDCRNVTLRGLTIDHDPLNATQGRIVALSEDGAFQEIELFEGYPTSEMVVQSGYEIIRPDTKTLRCHTPYLIGVEKLSPTRIRVNAHGEMPTHPDRIRVGDIAVIQTAYAPGGSGAHAVECARNVNVRIENVTVYSSNCFAFLEYDCDASTYYRCKVDRRPLESDLKPRAYPRLRGGGADAFHSNQAIKGPSIIECTAKFMADDAVNIHGSYDVVTECEGALLRVLAKHTMSIEAGDMIEIFSYDGTRLPDAKVTKIEPDGKMNEGEIEFMLAQRLNEHIRTRKDRDAFRITLDREVDLQRGTLVSSTRRMGNGFLVQGCGFGHNRSRGILIKASDGKVIGNKLTENWGEAIKVSPEYWWFESGSSNNVEISGNVIVNAVRDGIAVYAHGARELAPAGAHTNIVIADNTLVNCRGRSVLLTSTRDAVFRNNRLVYPSGGSEEGHIPCLVELENCEGVHFDGNRVLERDPGDDTPLEKAQGWSAVTSMAQGRFNIKKNVKGVTFAGSEDYVNFRLVRWDESGAKPDLDGMHTAAGRWLRPPAIVDWPEMVVGGTPAFGKSAFFGTATGETGRRKLAIEPGGINVAVGSGGDLRSRDQSVRAVGSEVEILLVPLVIGVEENGAIESVVLKCGGKTVYERNFDPESRNQKRGRIYFERWDGIEGKPVSALTSSEAYKGRPDEIVSSDRLEMAGSIGDNYGMRGRCILYPPKTGEYTFWIAGDDGISLRLSNDRSPEGVKEIASYDDWTRPYEWEKAPTQKSKPVHLEKGKEYYVEVFLKEALGGDHVAVAWERSGIEREVISGEYLSPWLGQVESVTLLLPAGARGEEYSLSVNGSEPAGFEVEFDKEGVPAPVRLNLDADGKRVTVRTAEAPATR